MVDWLAGKRVKGTSSERTTGTWAGLPSGSVGGWVELGRHTLGGTADNINVTSLSDKRYYMVLFDRQASGQCRQKFRLNSDTGSNYAYRLSQNGAADSTGTSQTDMGDNTPSGTVPSFSVSYIANRSANEKLLLGHLVDQSTAGAGTSPQRQEYVAKHAQTSNPVSAVNLYNDGSGDYASGSEVVVLGWDPADTHTTNFWQELASVTASGSSTNLSSGTITAKKYLWVQAFLDGTTTRSQVTFNNDTGSNYADRYNANGGNEGTQTSQAHFDTQGIFSSTNPRFFNMFIINNASNEKLCICHTVAINGTGATNAPNRYETVGKWTNTSNQITEIDLDSVSGNWGSVSELRVWGAD